MSADQLTCDQVDRDDFDSRYLSGRLTDAEALAFEAHYFACERCWALVRRGSEIRAATGSASGGAATSETARILEPGPAERRAGLRWHRWVPLVAAAAALVFWIGTRNGTPPPEPVSPPAVVRGSAPGLDVSASIANGAVRAVWPRASDAASYQVRIFDGGGTLLAERRVTDTVFSLALDVLATSGARFVMQVHALDLMGATVARSPLAEVQRDPGGR